MNDEAREIIKIAINQNSKTLDLSNLSLFELEFPDGDLSHVETLDLRGNHLELLPDSFYKLPNLRQLYLSDNELTELPVSLFRLKRLDYLNVSLNNLTYLPEDIGQLNSLGFINLSNNKLTELPVSFESLSPIYHINVSNNELQSLPYTISRLKELEAFIAYNNKLASLPHDFGELENLETLDLSNNQLIELPESFGGLINLSIFKVGNNLIKHLPENFGELNRLTELYIENNKLSELPVSFSNLPNLKYFTAKNNRLAQLPDNFFEQKHLSYLDLSRNRLQFSSFLLKGKSSLTTLNLSDNKLVSLPESINHLIGLTSLDISANKLTHLPESIGRLIFLNSLDCSRNKLTALPRSFTRLNSLRSLNLRLNKFETYPAELSPLQSDKLMVDYRENPFLDRALLRSQHFTKIWHDAPFQLREILKIYFGGFNSFYYQRTQKPIQFNVSNEPDALAFQITPDENTDPGQVDALLHEYYEILKTKLREGAESPTGMIYPNSKGDTADLFAQGLAMNFAQNANFIRQTVSGFVSNQDVVTGLSKSLDGLDDSFQQVVDLARKQALQIQEHKVAQARLEGRSQAQDEALGYHRQIDKIRAETPITFSIQQQVLIKQEVSNDFRGLREILYPHLSEFQRDEGKDLQKDIDLATAKPNLKPEEKTTLGKRIKGWINGTKEAVKLAKEAGAVGSDLVTYYDKLKDFAEGVLNDPNLAETIETVKQGIEGIM